MERLFEIESKIRDSEIIGLNIIWSNWLNNSKISKDGIIINFVKNQETIKAILQGIKNLEIYEDDFESQCISHVKCLKSENGLTWLVLDPYEENDIIDEKDNFKICFESIKIENEK